MTPAQPEEGKPPLAQNSTKVEKASESGFSSWLTGFVLLFSAMPMFVLLMGYGMAWAVEDRFGIPHAALYGSAMDLLDLGSLPMALLIERLGQVTGDGFWTSVWAHNWLVTALLLMVAVGWWARVRWFDKPSSAPLNKLADRVFGQVDKRHRFTGLLSVTALLYPWVIGMGTKLLLSVLVLPLGAIVLGVNHGLVYVDEHVVKPERCARVVMIDRVNPPAEKSGAALCLALDSEAGVEVAQVRISAIVDACFRLIVDGESVLPWRRWGSAQELV